MRWPPSASSRVPCNFREPSLPARSTVETGKLKNYCVGNEICSNLQCSGALYSPTLSPWTLQCSSFWGSILYILRQEPQQTPKGATLEAPRSMQLGNPQRAASLGRSRSCCAAAAACSQSALKLSGINKNSHRPGCC